MPDVSTPNAARDDERFGPHRTARNGTSERTSSQFTVIVTECNGSKHFLRRVLTLSVMILPQVHLRKPCYDFYFL